MSPAVDALVRVMTAWVAMLTFTALPLASVTVRVLPLTAVTWPISPPPAANPAPAAPAPRPPPAPAAAAPATVVDARAAPAPPPAADDTDVGLVPGSCFFSTTTPRANPMQPAAGI